MVTVKLGNIMEATEDIICQQVNCQGVMGTGLAKQIRDKYTQVYTEYKKLCDNYKNSRALMGKTLMVKVFCFRQGKFKYIANLFGQYYYGRDKVYTDYNALRKAFICIRKIAISEGKSVAIPYGIGCGCAGGNWDNVLELIEDEFNDINVTIYKYKR